MQTPSQVPQLISCPYCGSSISAKLRKCPQCQSYQGLLGKISDWAVPLNALSLFLAILAITMPIFAHLSKSHKAELQSRALKTDRDTIVFAVENSGDKPASMISATIVSKFLVNGTKVVSTTWLKDNFSSTVLEPNKVYAFSTTPSAAETSLPIQLTAEILANHPEIKAQLNTCTLQLVYTDFSGDDRIHKSDYSCYTPDQVVE